jgi:hypothetical protein
LNKFWHIPTLIFAASLLTAAQPAPSLLRVRQSTDVGGRVHQLGQTDGTKTIVFVFLGPECPISQRYVPELNRIASEHGSNPVEFYGVISGASITRTQAAAFTKEYRLGFPVLFDQAGHLARWLRPTHMPEAFVLKPDGDILYRGRINDWYASPGKPRAVIQHHELRDGISAVLVGKTPPKIFAPPVGCYFEDWPAERSKSGGAKLVP